MSGRYDAVFVGAGHNGLVCAAYLARSGLRVLVLERRDVVGGAATTEEIFPGFRFDSCAHRLGQLQPAVARDLDLGRHGVELLRPDPIVFAPRPDGGGLAIWSDPAKSAEEIRRHSPADAERWPRFAAYASPAIRFLEHAHGTVPPDLPLSGSRDLVAAMELGLRLRRLGRHEMTDVLRLLPMSAAELLDDWFESAPLRGILAAVGVTGIFLGPHAAGTAYLLLRGLEAGGSVLRATKFVRGGLGRLTEGLAAAARAHGGEIRTGADVAAILTTGGRASGVALAGGEEIGAGRVVSNADPKRTFLGLVDPLELDPEFLRAVRNIRMRGAFAKVHLALSELPRFRGVGEGADRSGGARHLAGAIRISPGLDYLERAYDDAKYGRVSESPYLEAVIPSLTDPDLAPPGRHVMSIYVQYAPHQLKDGAWGDGSRDALGDRVVATLSEYAPGLESAILHRHVLSPADLEETYGLTGGCASHGEMALDQLFFMRPVPGWARYRTPVRDLYLCGAGTHPGGGVTGAPGYNAAREILRDVKRGG